MRLFAFAVCVFVSVSAFTNVLAGDSMRCGTQLVSVGDTKVKVLSRCGDPDSAEIVGETTTYRLGSRRTMGSVALVIERWTYVFGTEDFLRILTFEGDRLVHIEQGGKP